MTGLIRATEPTGTVSQDTKGYPLSHTTNYLPLPLLY